MQNIDDANITTEPEEGNKKKQSLTYCNTGNIITASDLSDRFQDCIQLVLSQSNSVSINGSFIFCLPGHPLNVLPHKVFSLFPGFLLCARAVGFPSWLGLCISGVGWTVLLGARSVWDDLLLGCWFILRLRVLGSTDFPNRKGLCSFLVPELLKQNISKMICEKYNIVTRSVFNFSMSGEYPATCRRQIQLIV